MNNDGHVYSVFTMWPLLRRVYQAWAGTLCPQSVLEKARQSETVDGFNLINAPTVCEHKHNHNTNTAGGRFQSDKRATPMKVIKKRGAQLLLSMVSNVMDDLKLQRPKSCNQRTLSNVQCPWLSMVVHGCP